MKLHGGYRQTINHTLMILGYVQPTKHYSSNEVESLHQVAPPPIEAALRRDIREQISVITPVTEHHGFRIPTAAFTNQSHGDKFAIATHRLRPRPLEERRDLLPNIVDSHIHPQAEIIKIGYHSLVLQCDQTVSGNPSLSH
jgi:hypothetical protein